MANQNDLPTNSCTTNILVIFSTSGHDQKYFRFFKNIKKRNFDMFSDQFEYAEFNKDIKHFRSWKEVLPVMKGSTSGL